MRFTIRSAVGLGFLSFFLAILPGGVWTVLLVANLRTNPNIPWCVAAIGLLLWVMWRYLDGHWPPSSTSEARHRLLRAVSTSPAVFVRAVIGGVFGLVALAGFWIVLLQLVKLPPHSLPDFSKYPVITVTTVLLMSCLVSSFPEEAAFRGYFQSFLERKFPGAIAIIISAIVMAPAHCLTQGFVWPVVLFYLLVDSMLGVIAYVTKSILPGVVVHFIGLLIFFTLIWPQDAARTLEREAGASRWLWIHIAQIVICGTLALVIFFRLRVTRQWPAEPA
jgi:membrane protease YdiL (CAAX protease family)